MAVGDTVKMVATIQKKIFYNNDNWGIILCSLVSSQDYVATDYKGCFVARGVIPSPIEGENYRMTAEETYNAKYGNQYEIKSISLNVDITDNRGKRKYLEKLFTPLQVRAMHEALEDPFEVLKKKDFVSLVKVKGCGKKVGAEWCNKFEENYSLSRVYIELEDYELSNAIIIKLLRKYKSPDVVIEKVKTNPYILTEVKGVGWSTVDIIAQRGGIGKYDERRVGAYILYFLQKQTESGSTWVTNEDLMQGIIDNLGADTPDVSVTKGIYLIQDKLWWNENKTRIGLKYMRILEENIADEILRLKNSDNTFKYDNWEGIIKKKEMEQGWSYTDKQLNGIKLALEENLIVIHGLAGTGKTTIVDAILDILSKYSSAMCALAGRAGARLAEVSGREGYTIHRLLGFPLGSKENQYFEFNKENPLSHDIIIVDEISMIGGKLFYSLLRAIKTGAKVILLGDIGQLESIGECKVAVDLIESPEIPTVYLDEIHRQAAKSAIITESINMRHGQQIVDRSFVGIERRGEFKDLEINVYSDKSNTFYNTMQYVSTLIEQKVKILDMQVICPRKDAGDACTANLNYAIQLLYNPESKDKNELEIKKSKAIYTIREGDKVINVKNHKDTCNPDTNKRTPIFNGNIGIVHRIDPEQKYMLIDFQNIGRVFIPKKYFDSIELGYAITVHKMQGDQKEHIIVAIDNTSYTMLSRELLYTAVTRASKMCYLVAQNTALSYAITQEKNNNKNTSLKNILYEKTHEKFSF